MNFNIADERQFIIDAVSQARIPTVHPDAANTVDIGRAVLAAYRRATTTTAAPLSNEQLDTITRYGFLPGSEEPAGYVLRSELDALIAQARAAQAHHAAATTDDARSYTREDVQKWRDDVANAAADMVQRASPSFGSGDWSWLTNAIRGLASQQPARQAQVSAPAVEKVEITREGAMFWHTNCPKNHFKSGVMRETKREADRSLIECGHCGKSAYYPVSGVGTVCADEVGLTKAGAKGNGGQHG